MKTATKITVTKNNSQPGTEFYSPWSISFTVDGVTLTGDFDYFNDTLRQDYSDVGEIEVLGLFHLLTMDQRVELVKTCYNILKKDGICRVVAPHWSSSKAYMDPGIQWPPVAAEFFFLTKAEHRKQLAPHVDFGDVDFFYSISGNYDTNDAFVAMRNDETKSTFMHRNINCTTDIVVNLHKTCQTVST